jgi:catechol 2,3-dioxygenase-like lactoylglutathione lyase family enzyme
VIALDQINLVVADPEATLRFYRLLGVKIPERAIWRTPSGIHHVGVECGHAGLDFDSRALAKVYNAGFRPGRASKAPAAGNVVIGFTVGSRRRVDALYEKAVAAGYRGLQPPWDAFWGARYAIVADPDGNHVGLMSPRDPRKRAPAPPL